MRINDYQCNEQGLNFNKINLKERDPSNEQEHILY